MYGRFVRRFGIEKGDTSSSRQKSIVGIRQHLDQVSKANAWRDLTALRFKGKK
jgi:hypothetical protein